MKPQKAEILQDYRKDLETHKKILEAYISGMEIPGFRWNEFDDIYDSRETFAPIELQLRAMAARQYHNRLRWEICREMFPKMEEAEDKVVNSRNSGPISMLFWACKKGFIGEEEYCDLLRKIQSLEITKYREKFIELWKDIVEIEKEYMDLLEPKLLLSRNP